MFILRQLPLLPLPLLLPEVPGISPESAPGCDPLSVRKIAKEGKMKAVVSITIDDEFVVHDIKVIEGEKGLFIAMPSRIALYFVFVL